VNELLVIRRKGVANTVLAPRAYEVAEMVSQGKTNKEIANLLHLSLGTVKNYVSSIFVALELKNRTELANLLNKEKAYNKKGS